MSFKNLRYDPQKTVSKRLNDAFLLSTLLTIYSVIDSEKSEYPRVTCRFVSLFNKNVSCEHVLLLRFERLVDLY